MAEYIKKSCLMDHIEKEWVEYGEEYDAQQILGDIEDFPAVDVDVNDGAEPVLEEGNTVYHESRADGTDRKSVV